MAKKELLPKMFSCTNCARKSINKPEPTCPRCGHIEFRECKVGEE